MRRTGLWFMTIMTLLLTGCGAAREQAAFESWRGGLAAAAEITFDAQIRACWQDGASSFAVRVTHRDGETAATVTAPEPIAGIVFRRGAEKGSLEFDGLILDMDAGHEDEAAPCDAPWLLLAAITDGWPTAFGREGAYDTVSLEAPGGDVLTLWRAGDGTPVYAEIARGGVTQLTITIEN